MQRKSYIKRSRNPVPPQTILIAIFCGLVAKIIIWENWFCVFIMEVQWKMYIPKAPGPRIPQTILVIICLDLAAWVIIWENLILLFNVENARGFAYPKVPGPRVHQTILITTFWGLVSKVVIWENSTGLFIIENATRIKYPQSLWNPGPLNHISYCILCIRGQDYNFGELDLFVHQLEHNGNYISHGPRDPGPPKPY